MSYMDRNNGGDPLAPPRPPKQQPKVHRPRAPEPLMSMDRADQQQPLPLPPRSSLSSTSSTSSSPSITTTTNISSPHHHQQQQQPPPKLPLRPTAVVQPIRQPPSSHSSSSALLQQQQHVSRSATPVQVNPPTTAPLVPLQQQQQSITFARRRPSPHQQQQHQFPGSPLLSGGGARTHSSSGSPPPGSPFSAGAGTSPIISTLTRNLTNLSNNLINNLNITQLTAGGGGDQPNSVTLAVPRPENERLTNEYVDTPFTHLRTNHNSNSNVNSSLPQHLLNHHHLNNNNQLPSSQSGGLLLSHNVNSNSPQLPSRTTTGPGRPQQQHQHQGIDSVSTLSSTSPTTRLLSGGESAIIAQPVKLLGSNAIGHDQSVITKQPTFNKDKTDLHSIDKLDGAAELSANLIDGHRIGVVGPGSGHTIAVGLLNHGNGGGMFSSDGPASITCPRCERCRCQNCQKPRPLPSKWVCGKSLYCSAETMTDYLTCLCCVKALFYHCSNNPELDNENGNSISCADDPCSCLPHKRAARWGFLSAISLLLPCLICYWPMKGATALCAKCYASYSREGCRCNNNKRSRQLEQLQFVQSQQPTSQGDAIGGHHHPMGKKVFPAAPNVPSAGKQLDNCLNRNQTSNSSKKQIDCDSNRMLEGVGTRTRLDNTSFCGGESEESARSCCGNSEVNGPSSGGISEVIRTLRITSPNSTTSSTSSTLSLLRSHNVDADSHLQNHHLQQQNNLLDISPDY